MINIKNDITGITIKCSDIPHGETFTGRLQKSIFSGLFYRADSDTLVQLDCVGNVWTGLHTKTIENYIPVDLQISINPKN